MKIEDFTRFDNVKGVSGLFFATGTFGIINGNEDYSKTEEKNKTVYTLNYNGITLRAEFIKEKNGAFFRRDYLTNGTGKDINVTALRSRFILNGENYSAYTQYNGWLNESNGGWTEIFTEVDACCRGIRSCESATPVLAVKSPTALNMVFHLLPNCQWQMKAYYRPIYEKTKCLVVETGFFEDGLNLTVKNGDTVNLPQVIFYQFKSELDLDAYKLHEVYRERYPRKRMPVIYNSWLMDFDGFTPEKIFKEIDACAKLGVEIFTIDAGWFGKKFDWGDSVGDWEEDKMSATEGKLKEISDRVREKGMIFGLWFEPERTGKKSNAFISHPEDYIEATFLDFSSDVARERILSAVSKTIKEYNIGFVKFDFNASTPFEEKGDGFYYYNLGQKKFVESLKTAFPNLIISNCASGGHRMDLYQATYFDSFWLSDNQGVLDGVRIVKDTLKRLPFGCIERWNVQKTVEGFPVYGKPDKKEIVLTCNDATWDNVLSVNPSFTFGFLTGGPLGISCSVSEFSKEYFDKFKDFIEKYKKERDIYLNANSSILIDEKEYTAIEIFDEDKSNCKILLFVKRAFGEGVRVFPKVDENAVYLIDGEKISGKEISEDGVVLYKLFDNSCVEKDLKRVK